jgi:predicted dehydrogenase
MPSVSLAVVGAGQVGRRHAELVAAAPEARLAGIVDPAPQAKKLAEDLGTRWFQDFAQMLAQGKPEGVIIATPNQLHVTHGLEALAAGLPALVEKPLADSVEGATRLVEAAEAAELPLLVGHHRRYNPMIHRAKEMVDSGRLGKILTVHGHFWLRKPDDYFDVEWRREKGAGPIYINLIHDIDLFRHLFGAVASVQALDSNAARGNPVEDAAVILLHFVSGVLGTLNVSDAVVAPWSWELTAGENPVFPRQDQSCYQIGGTLGAMTVPQLEVWSNAGKPGWLQPLRRERVHFVPQDPLAAQVRHFCAVIQGREAPLIPGREGLETLKVIDAVKTAAATGGMVSLV